MSDKVHASKRAGSYVPRGAHWRVLWNGQQVSKTFATLKEALVARGMGGEDYRISALQFQDPETGEWFTLPQKEFEKIQMRFAGSVDDANEIDFGSIFTRQASGSVDTFLQGKSHALDGPHHKGVQEALKRPSKVVEGKVNAGLRVAFTGTPEALLSYDYSPEPGARGTVIKVKSAGHKATGRDGLVHVLWDTGTFLSVRAEHLERAPASKVKRATGPMRLKVGGLGDLTGVFASSSGLNGDELIHKATRDLWSFRQEGGAYVLERLFNDDGKPLKC